MRAFVFLALAACAHAHAQVDIIQMPPDFVATAPTQPLAGLPTTLVFALPTLNGIDLERGTPPHVHVEGRTIRVDPNLECQYIFCDLIQDAAIKVELPALAAGSYEILVEDVDSGFPPRRFEISVVEGSAPVPIHPASGVWTDPERPGAGFSLHVRNDEIVVSVLDHARYSQTWQMDLSPLHANELLLAPVAPIGGSCLGCAPYRAPSLPLSVSPMRLRFESARRARVDLANGETRYFVAQPFGTRYLDPLLPDEADSGFGPLPLPELQGRWAFDAPNQPRVLSLDQGIRRTDRRIDFPATGTAAITLECSGATSLAPAGCWLRGLPVGSRSFAPAGDVTEDRIRFRIGMPSSTDYFDAVRLTY